MVKLLAIPKNFDGQLDKKLAQGWGQGMVAEILRPCDGQPHVTVALCQDGKGDYQYDVDNIRRRLQTRLNQWSPSWGLVACC